MKKITTFATLVAAVMMTLSSCSGSKEESALFGTLPAEYAEMMAQRDELKEQGKNVKTQEEKEKLIKKGQELDEKWTPKLEKAATELNGKEIELANDSLFKVTEPLSLTFEKLSKQTLSPVFKVNGTAETTEPINIENTFSPYRSVYITGLDAEGNKVFSTEVGKIYGNVNLNVLEIPVGTKVEFSTLKFVGNYEYPKVKTLKLTL